MNRLTFLLALLSLTVALPAADKPKDVSVNEAQKLIQEGKVLVLDVRTPEEFKEGHIEGAVNIDFNGKDFATQIKKLDPSKPVLVHCQGGGRSGRSLPLLEQLSFPQVYHLHEGFGEWEAAGKPVKK
jgi:rhodanese-related sulfurtransferase